MDHFHTVLGWKCPIAGFHVGIKHVISHWLVFPSSLMIKHEKPMKSGCLIGTLWLSWFITRSTRGYCGYTYNFHSFFFNRAMYILISGRLMKPLCVEYVWLLLSGKLTVRPCHFSGWQICFQQNWWTVQGQSVNLQRCKHWVSRWGTNGLHSD